MRPRIPNTCDELPTEWRERAQRLHSERLGYGRFLEVLDCNKLIDETFRGQRYDDIAGAIAAMEIRISFLSVPERQA